MIIQKRDSATGRVLSDAQFRVTTAGGCEVGLDGVIGDSTLTQNGIFTTDSSGEIHITNLAPGAYVLTEIKAPDGYVMDAPSTNVVIGEGGDTQTVVITNSKAGSLIIDKRDSLTGEPLEGVTFKVTTLHLQQRYLQDRQEWSYSDRRGGGHPGGHGGGDHLRLYH